MSLIVFCVLAATPASAKLVINELYYDHPGADAGHEFIELINHGPDSVSLDGIALEFHNGAGTGWTTVWRAEPGRWIDPGDVWVVGGALVHPLPDAVAELSLQNGPDAVRVVGAAGTPLDLVAYGGLDDDEAVEGRAVPALQAGLSAARIPDGDDTDDNAADLVASTPTPGRRNVARHDVGLVLADGTPARSGRAHPGVERFGLLLVNLGLEVVPAAAVELVGIDSTAAGFHTFAGETNAVAVAPGGSTRVSASVSLAPGYHWIAFSVRYRPDERAGNDTVTVLRRAERIPILVSEVWSAPRDGCPQFVELVNAGGATIDITGYSIRDARSRPAALAGGELIVEPGGVVAVTADPSALLACAPGTPASRVIGVAGTWPTFNRSGGSIADSVVVLDSLGIPVDAVAYPGMGGATGRSLERVDLFVGAGPAVWRVSGAAGLCSPGRPNPESLTEAPRIGSIVASPNPFAPHRGEVLRLAIHAAPPVARVDAHVYDAEGRKLVALGSAPAFPALLLWDGRGPGGEIVAPGVYLIACEARLRDGTTAGVTKVVVGCAARRR